MKFFRFTCLLSTFGIAGFAGCVEVEEKSGSPHAGGSAVGASHEIIIDGSSTVEPISTRVAEYYRKVVPEVQVSVGTSGTGGGFKKFIAGESDINDASRPIKESEAESCEQRGIDFVELKIAIDGLSVVVNPENDFCDALTVDQLKSIWEPDSGVTTWKDVNPDWPEETIGLYGPDTDSGTFDYFTETICGESGACRSDYTASSNDNDLVLGVTEDKYALGYFGYAYYLENKDRLRAVPISPTRDTADAVAPTDEAIRTGTYTPLSRPLFIYVRRSSLERPEIESFIRFYLGEGARAVSDAGYVPLSDDVKAESLSTLDGK